MNKLLDIRDRFKRNFQEEVYIIAEMSANHCGSYEKAKELIHVAKNCGANCIKVQVYKPETITLDGEQDYFKIKEGEWKDQSLFELYAKAFTPWEWIKPLKEIADSIGIDFLATPFDESSVDLLESIGIEFYKVASAEVNHIPLIKYIADKGKPMILSSGMASLSDLELAVNTIKNTGNNDICIMKCSSVYPADYNDLNLKTIPNLNQTFNVIPGFSDHALGSTSAIVAVALGARIIEKHLCKSNDDNSVDAFFSLDETAFKNMVDELRLATAAIGRVNYQKSNKENQNQKYKRSILVSKAITKGEIITEENIKVVRPGVGIEPKYKMDLIGKISTSNLDVGDVISWKDIDY